MDGPSGGWILLQDRATAIFNFHGDWLSFEKGFGTPGWGYWLGNKNMHSITFKRNYILRVELPGFADVYAEYDNFQVLSPSSNYVLKLGKYRGGLRDVLSDLNNAAFCTWDRDNDEVDGQCARIKKGAWWYGKDCDAFDMNSMLRFVRTKLKAKEVFEGNVL